MSESAAACPVSLPDRAADSCPLCAQVTALLVELAEMRRADPGAKAVVFSAWGRLLKLVGGALAANGLEHVSLAGAQPEARAAALHRFLTDPACAVILIVLSTGGARLS